jgi:hypothetical protein
MAKAITWIIFLGVLGGGAFYSVKMVSEDPGHMVGMAFGNASETAVDIHIAVPISMPKVDPPPLNADFKPDWPQWIIDHYDVRDAAGNAVVFRRNINSTLITDNEIRFPPDCYLVGQMTPGTTYTFELTPKLSEPEKYKFEMVAPSEKVKFSRKTFKPAY